MNKLLYFWIVLFCLVGCRHQEPTLTATLLHQAERCMDAHPDSALLLLNTIASPTSLQGKEQAEYALLFTQAMDKSQRLGRNDSLIRFAVDYYTDGDDDLKATKSLFYYGKIKRNANKEVDAIEIFLEALKKIPSNTNDKVRPLLYYYLAYCYNMQNMYDEAISYNRKCYQAYMQLKDTANTFFSLDAIAHNYLLQNQIDSSLCYYNRALRLAQYVDNRIWQSILLEGIAKLYFFKKDDISTAYKYITKSIETNKTLTAVCTKGEILMKMQCLDSAKHCFNYVLENDDNIYSRARCYLALRKIEKQQKNFEQAYIYTDSSDVYVDSIYNKEQRLEVNKLTQFYQLEMRKRELAQQQTRHYLILFVSIVTMALGYFSFRQFRKRKKKELELQTQALEFASKIKTMNEYIEAKFGKEAPTQEAIGNFRKERYKESVIAFRASSWQERLSVITPEQEREKYMNMEEQSELFKTIDRLFADFIYDLRRHYPKMNEGDIYCCVLTLLQYRSKTISYITHLSMDALRSRKSRLKRYLSADDFEFIFQGKSGESSLDIPM